MFDTLKRALLVSENLASIKLRLIPSSEVLELETDLQEVNILHQSGLHYEIA